MKNLKTFEQLNSSNINIKYDEESEMIQIINSEGEVVFGGNYWDFERSPGSFKNLFESIGLSVEMTKFTYE